MSKLDHFPGYEMIVENGKVKNMYRGIDMGLGGYVYSEPGFYGNVALLDVASLHPNSIIQLNKFGKHTKIYKDILEARLAIKHHEIDKAKKMLGGKLAPYLTNEDDADNLAGALKLIANSTYGFGTMKIDNPFRDSRDKNNIVALRGALFMKTLQDAVVEKGFKVIHVKTDSLKIPDATPEIIKFVMDFGADYGYSFEHEATYERMCLVDKANYVCKYADKDWCEKYYGYIPGDNAKKSGKWDATGDKFVKPYYIFKMLFTHEPIYIEDLSCVKEVKTQMYLDHFEGLPDVSAEEKELKKLETKYKKGEISDTTFETERRRLSDIIQQGHCYKFIGKVGNFVPVVEGCDGGYLVKDNDRTGKKDAVTGTKGYIWHEAEYVKENELEGMIDMTYFEIALDDIREEVLSNCQNGDFEWFLSDDPYILPKYDKNGAPIYPDVVPFDYD